MSSGETGQNVEVNTLNKLVETIQDVQTGLDPDVLASWYGAIESSSKALCPTDELRESIYVIQNPDLPMKFQFKTSKRAIPFVVEAIESNLNYMPFATRLYFQKFEEIMSKELKEYLTQQAELNRSSQATGP
ncbi:MAG: hypothetical protein ACYC7D_12060 [Nitrososphaerales archaeon]